MRISDWSSDVCSSDLVDRPTTELRQAYPGGVRGRRHGLGRRRRFRTWRASWRISPYPVPSDRKARPQIGKHTSELQSLMRISYAVFCLKKKNNKNKHKKYKQVLSTHYNK